MRLRVPGDKSITQRALLLSALATGESRLRGLLTGADPRSVAAVLRRLGAEVPALPTTPRGGATTPRGGAVPPPDGSEIRVAGRGLRGLSPPDGPLDCGNSGTAARLLLGVLAAQEMEVVLTGDASLRSRPMARVTEPLSAMGATFESLERPGRLPLRVRGGALGPLEYETPVASAQVKSALLLAGLCGSAFVLLTEPGRSRDHTERMLALVGVPLVEHDAPGGGWRVELRDPPDAVAPLDFDVPGDLSSAAFFLVLGLLGGGPEELILEGVGVNPTRTGILPVLRRMGARFEVRGVGDGSGGEPRGDLAVAGARDLTAVEVGADEIPGLIDEVPILAVAAARAHGTTRITGARELRVKETDRLAALARNLRAVGVEAEELEDGLEIVGTDAPLRGRVTSHGDHRIAMAFAVLGALPGNEIEVDDPAVVEVSFPGFWERLREVTSEAEPGAPPPSRQGREGPVVTLDGPAGSGKSTTARAVARRLGFRHLDSGALYRALTWALLEEGIDPDRWDELSEEELRELDLAVRPTAEDLRISYRGRALGDEELRGTEVTRRVSDLARLPAVRERLLDLQRDAGRKGRLVADGRDMGTVVFPDAEAKVFLTADLEERARRRLGDRGSRDPDPGEVREEAERIRLRDRQDEEREHSPLRRPDDALVLDTTELSFEEQVEAILRHVRGLTRS